MKATLANVKKEWCTPKVTSIKIQRTLGSKSSGLESNSQSNNGNRL